jgi:adenine phosphoribosyltransferase
MNLKDYIAAVQDFPIEGILFRDITPLLANGEAYKQTCEEIAKFAESVDVDVIAGPESRGFIFGCPVATSLEVGFVPIRKPNKLPRETVSQSYDLEYGTNTLCMHKDAIIPGQKVVIVDDLLATGGTLVAACKLIESLGGIVAGIVCVIELVDLNGRDALNGYNVHSILKY